MSKIDSLPSTGEILRDAGAIPTDQNEATTQVITSLAFMYFPCGAERCCGSFLITAERVGDGAKERITCEPIRAAGVNGFFYTSVDRVRIGGEKPPPELEGYNPNRSFGRDQEETLRK